MSAELETFLKYKAVKKSIHGSIVGWMILKQGFVEAEVCHLLLQPAVLVGELLQFVDLLRLKPAILLLPAMEGLLRNPHLPDQVGHSQPHLRLLQNRNNLPSRKTLLLHSRYPLFKDRKSAEKLISKPYHFARDTSRLVGH